MTSTWQPTRFRRYLRSLETSTGPSEIVTETGPAFIKALGNKEGPHVLASEWVCTHLARWLGLPTFDIAIMQVTAHDEIPLGHGRHAEQGPAVVLRRERGHPWGGEARELELIDNPDDVGRLLVFDTWVQNVDRHPPEGLSRKPNYDNVFFSEEGASPGRFVLKSMDHTHCFASGGVLSVSIAGIDRIREERLYGLFPAFKPFVTRSAVEAAVGRLRALDAGFVMQVINEIPQEWDVTAETRQALARLVLSRADFLATWVPGEIASLCYPQEEIDFDLAEGGA